MRALRTFIGNLRKNYGKIGRNQRVGVEDILVSNGLHAFKGSCYQMNGKQEGRTKKVRYN